MGKDIEWLVQMIITEQDMLQKRLASGKVTPNETTFNEGRGWALAHVLEMIYNMDKLEVLSQEWIDENKVAIINNLRKMTTSDVVTVEKLQNLLVPKQELPVIPEYVANWIDEMKQDERPLYSVMSSLMNKTNHEWAVWKNANKDFSEIVAQAWLDGYTVEEAPLYHALVKGHELLTREYAFKFWSYDTLDDVVFTSELPFQKGRYVTEMIKEAWDKLGINDSNAEFVKVNEVNINEKEQ